MAAITPQRAAQAAWNAGLRDTEALATAVAVAWAESGLDPMVVGDTTLTDSTWGPSYGLWQVRSLWNKRGTGDVRDPDALAQGDPDFQARAMHAISGGGTNWQPWSVYTNGAFQQYLPAARQIAQQLAGSGGTTSGRRVGEAVVDLLSSMVGLCEDPPGSNLTPIGAYWGLDGVPWCALTVSYAYAKVGAPLPDLNGPNGMYSYVPSAAAWARSHNEITDDPQPGDVIVFGIVEDEDHTGVFERWIDRAAGRMSTLEGNTSNADADPDQTNGWYLARRVRHTSQVVLFWRPAAAAAGATDDALFGPASIRIPQPAHPEEPVIRPAIKRTADWDGRPVWDLAWMPADGTRLGQNAVHAAVVIAAVDPDTTVDPANPAAADVFFSGINGDGQPDFRQQRVVLGPQGAAVAVPLHGRVSVVGQPARELLVEAREVVYTP